MLTKELALAILDEFVLPAGPLGCLLLCIQLKAGQTRVQGDV